MCFSPSTPLVLPKIPRSIPRRLMFVDKCDGYRAIGKEMARRGWLKRLGKDPLSDLQQQFSKELIPQCLKKLPASAYVTDSLTDFIDDDAFDDAERAKLGGHYGCGLLVEHSYCATIGAKLQTIHETSPDIAECLMGLLSYGYKRSSFYSYTTASILDSASNIYWEGAEDEKWVLENYKDEQIEVVKREEIVQGIPEWALNPRPKLNYQQFLKIVPRGRLRKIESYIILAQNLIRSRKNLNWRHNVMRGSIQPLFILRWADDDSVERVADDEFQPYMESGTLQQTQSIYLFNPSQPHTLKRAVDQMAASLKEFAAYWDLLRVLQK